MKIGILSMYYRRNYGGILQSYALFKTIEHLGHTPVIINYKSSDTVSSYNWHYLLQYIIKKIKSEISHKKKSKIATKPLSKELLNAFADFKQKHLAYTEPVNEDSIKKITEDFEAIVFGSDQIWNGVNKKRLVFFGECISEKPMKIAYAPCTVIEKPPYYNKSKLSRLLGGFTALSARDNVTSGFINQCCGKNVPIVIDPTGLHSFEEFVSPRKIEEPYIFSYILGSEISGGHASVIRKIKEKYGDIKIISVVISNVSLEAEKFADTVYYDASPSDWVNLISNASFVYTDSFHGIMFSMKFHKPFVAYYHDKLRASRLLDLKKTLNLRNIINNVADVDLDNEIDYTQVDSTLSSLAKESYAYLSKSLSD